MTREPVVAVPVDLDVEDRLAGPVTFRMAGWLAAAASGAGLALAAPGQPAALAAGAVLAFLGLVGAWWRPGGRPATAWLAPLWRYRRRRRSAPDEAAVPLDHDAASPRDSATAAAPRPTPELPEEWSAEGARRQAWTALARVLLLPTVVVVAGIGGAAAMTVTRGGGADHRPTPPQPPPPTAQPERPPDRPHDTVVVIPLDPFWQEELDDPSLGFDCLC